MLASTVLSSGFFVSGWGLLLPRNCCPFWRKIESFVKSHLPRILELFSVFVCKNFSPRWSKSLTSIQYYMNLKFIINNLLQMPILLHRSYKLWRSGVILNWKVVFLRCIQRHDLDQFLAMRTYITNFQYWYLAFC